MSRGFVVKGGKILPQLSRPAGAAQILSGYQAIDQEGEVLTGTSTAKVLPNLSAPAGNDDVRIGKEAISQAGTIMIGTYVAAKYKRITIGSDRPNDAQFLKKFGVTAPVTGDAIISFGSDRILGVASKLRDSLWFVISDGRETTYAADSWTEGLATAMYPAGWRGCTVLYLPGLCKI